jgi:hypothetical protein
MGVERKDGETGSTPRTRKTDPGVGPASVPHTREDAGAAANGHSSSEGGDPSVGADVVDFDALNAALGPPPAPSPSSPSVSDSQGRSNATYASAPHAIPTTRAPVDERHTPAVIVDGEVEQSDQEVRVTPPPIIVLPQQAPLLDVQDTLPTAPPDMTLPMPPGGGGVVITSGGVPIAGTGSSGAPQSSQAVSPNPQEIVAFTLQMPDRPRPRPRTPTMALRTRQPTWVQKVIVFVAMLFVFVAGGIAFLIYYKPPGLRIDDLFSSSKPATSRPHAVATAAPSAMPIVTPSAVLAAPTLSTAPSATPPGTNRRPRGR